MLLRCGNKDGHQDEQRLRTGTPQPETAPSRLRVLAQHHHPPDRPACPVLPGQRTRPRHPRDRRHPRCSVRPSLATHSGRSLTHAHAAGWPGGTSPPGSHRSVRKPLGLYGSCHPHYQTRGTEGTHFQCANMRGYLSTTPRQHFMAFFLARNRLYFLRIQHTK